MNLQNSIPFNAGKVRGILFGGPYKQYEPNTRRLVGVKMAKEITHPHDISIPTVDFSVPDTKDMIAGMAEAIEAIYAGNDIYVGCMGGIGRTGLFLACMHKVELDYYGKVGDPVAYVRKHYYKHAIETEEQKNYVRTINTDDLVRRVRALSEPKVIYTRVTETVTQSPLQYLVQLIAKVFKY